MGLEPIQQFSKGELPPPLNTNQRLRSTDVVELSPPKLQRPSGQAEDENSRAMLPPRRISAWRKDNPFRLTEDLFDLSGNQSSDGAGTLKGTACQGPGNPGCL